MGAIVHAVANRALSNHTGKNIFGNVNYAKHFLQGTIVGFFDGRKNAIWKLTVDFEMPSGGAEVDLKRVVIHCQHCILGPVPVGKNPRCSVTFTDSIGDPDHAVKGSSTYLPNTEARAIAASAAPAATTTNDNDDATPTTLLLPTSHCRWHLSSQHLPTTRSGSSCLLLLQRRRGRGRRPRLATTRCCQHLSSQHLPTTRSGSSCLLLPQRQRGRGRRLRRATTHRPQRRRRLPPSLQRRARPPKKEKSLNIRRPS